MSYLNELLQPHDDCHGKTGKQGQNLDKIAVLAAATSVFHVCLARSDYPDYSVPDV